MTTEAAQQVRGRRVMGNLFHFEEACAAPASAAHPPVARGSGKVSRHVFAFPCTIDNEVNAKPQNVFRGFGDCMATGHSAVKRG